MSSFTVDLNTIKTFPNLHPKSFQQPLDATSTSSLSSVPLLPSLLSWLHSNSVEQLMRQHHLRNTLRIDHSNGGVIYEAFEHAAAVLDVKQMPEVFIQNSPIFNAFAMGTENYSIVLTSAIVDALSPDEILAVVGHELGHIKCEHMLYKTVCHLLSIVGLDLLKQLIPGVGSAASLAIGYAMANWSRKAELSCDREALLATQDVNIVTNLTLLLASGTKKVLPELSLESALKQQEDLNEIENTLLGKLMIIQELEMSHPIPIVRCSEINAWSKTQDYRDLLNGKYIRGKEITPNANGPIAKLCIKKNAIV